MMIRLVKLVTGEEILTKVLEQDSTNIKVENPVKLALTQKGVGMVPLSPFLKDSTLTIAWNNVVYMAEADEELANAYNGQFGGIVTAPPGLILG